MKSFPILMYINDERERKKKQRYNFDFLFYRGELYPAEFIVKRPKTRALIKRSYIREKNKLGVQPHRNLLKKETVRHRLSHYPPDN